MLAWATLLLAILVSFRPAVPAIWGDTPPFVESALRTLEAGQPIVTGGRDPGYPTFLAVTFAFGGDLGTVVRLQQAAWVVLMLALAATTQAATRNAVGLVPIILVATYPGLLLFRNVLTADLLFAVFLNLATAGLLVATCVDGTARCCAVVASILCAAAAACLRSQGFLVPIAAILVGAHLARPATPARLAVMAVSVATALALLLVGSRFGASNSDQASAVFVPKTLFCNHLNIVLASDAARREIVSQAGDRADATMARLAADFAAEPGRWPVLGFFGDACLFDTELDRDLADNTGNALSAAAAFWRIFLAAVRDRPLAYAGKFVRQMAYGLWLAWPPYGLEPAIPVSTDDVPHVSEIMTRHGRATQLIDLQSGPVRVGLLSELPGMSAYLFKGLSAAFVIAVIFWTVAAARRRRRAFVTRAGIVIAMWAASIATAAGAHTLDVWRYLIPAVPIVGLMLSLFVVELTETIVADRAASLDDDQTCDAFRPEERQSSKSNRNRITLICEELTSADAPKLTYDWSICPFYNTLLLFNAARVPLALPVPFAADGRSRSLTPQGGSHVHSVPRGSRRHPGSTPERLDGKRPRNCHLRQRSSGRDLFVSD